MKIAIPVDEKSLDSNVCVSFGRTPYFLIYDVDTKESVFLDNSAAASTGGAGIKAAQTIVDNKTNEFAEWDNELLKEELFKLPSLNMKLFGFEEEQKEEQIGSGRELY